MAIQQIRNIINNQVEGQILKAKAQIKTEAKKGLTLIFPTDWTHSHKSVISKTHEKYIVTGWYHYGNYT